MSRYKAYPEYKDSEAIWLGEIPADWNLYEGKRLFSSRREAAREDDEQLAASQKYGVIPQNVMMELNDAKVMLALKGTNSFRHVDKNNFVISLRSFEGGIEHSSYVGCVSPAYTVLRSEKDIAPGYFKYLLKSAPYIAALQASTDSLRDGKSISYEQFGAIPLPYPQPEVQSVIASFLDHETAKIDALIEKQQRLIALLKEKRQAVISHAVTKGLNANAPMKDSGVEWLGEVPAHWDVKKFSHCTIVKSGQVDPTRLPYSGFTLIAPNHIESGTGKIIGLEISEAQGADSGKYLCSEGEVIYSKIRPNLAKVCLSPSNETICSADMYPISGINGLSNKFLYWSLLSNWFTSFVTLESDRVAMPKINREKLAEILLPIPPENEQAGLAVWLKNKTDIVDSLLEKARNGIELLQERRTALISAAVTGKIDVRDWQAAA